MKKYNPAYYLLFILLVTGTFASMAQNSYGLKMIGGVAFVFALVFLAEFVTRIRKGKRKNFLVLAEPFCLFLLAVIFGFRVFYVYFPYVEYLFVTASLVLAVLFFVKMVRRFRDMKDKNMSLALLGLVFHVSIICFLTALAVTPFSLILADTAGTAGFVLLAIFVLAGLLKRKFSVDGEQVSPFGMVRVFPDHSIVIVTLFVLFSLYTGLNRLGILPGIYSDEFPRAYYTLVDDAASKDEKPVDGQYRYQKFMEQYQLFIRHHKAEFK